MKDKPKVLGFMTLFYGREYLFASLMSVREHVDKMHIAYTANPSHGFNTDQKCPDSEEEMKHIAMEVMGDKLIWDRAENYPSEAHHRNMRYKHSTGFDVIMTIDADEVFKEDEIPAAIEYASNMTERYAGIKGYINFYRSFSHVCKDSFRPIRFEKLNAGNQLQNLECPLTIYHFSTAQREEIMRFKYKIFGHASEIKKDWLEKTYFAWTPEKNEEIEWLHPTSVTIWHHAEPFDKTILPEYLKYHVNFNKHLI